MTIPPWAVATAALVVMLWIVWSDSIRIGRSHPSVYYMRVVLYLATSAVLAVNLWRRAAEYSIPAKAIAVLAALAGVGGAVHFLRKGMEPLPTGRRSTDPPEQENPDVGQNRPAQ